MQYKITDPLETVTFVEGHNQFGPNSLSHYTIFIGEDGERYVPKPGRDQIWLKLVDIRKEIHEPGKFLNRSHKWIGFPASEQQFAEAFKVTSEIQRMPQRVLKPEFALPLLND